MPLAPLVAPADSFCRLGPRTLTVAPGSTAPLASRMVPAIEPVICAAASRGASAPTKNSPHAACPAQRFMARLPRPPRGAYTTKRGAARAGKMVPGP